MIFLITGASGLIGSSLIDRLRGGNNEIICQSRNSEHEDELNVKWICHDLIYGDWRNQSLPEFDVVIHLAGQTSVYEAKQDPVADLNINVIGFLNLLDYVKLQQKPAIVVLAGTATQVGLTEEIPINENVPDKPITFYDISKLTAEMYLKQYVREGWVKGCTLRFANVFGGCKDGQQKDRGIIDKVFNRAMSGKNILIYGDGNYIRDYIYIEDVISALVLAAKNAEQTNGRAFLIGSGQGLTLKDAFLKVISLAQHVTGIRVDYEYVDAPEGLSEIEYRNAIIDSSSFKEATGWIPQYTFETGLANAYNALRIR